MNLSIVQELGADGVIVSEEGYGNPDTDLCLNAKNFELAGIKSVVVSDEAAGTDGASQSLADATPEMTGAFVRRKRYLFAFQHGNKSSCTPLFAPPSGRTTPPRREGQPGSKGRR